MAQEQQQPRGRRSGPEPASGGAPADADRAAAEGMMKELRERLDREREDAAAAAVPAEGGEPSESQRQAAIDAADRAAERRASAVRANRRTAAPSGVVYDDERENVQRLLDERLEARTTELADRGITDPSFEARTAGYDPDAGPAPEDDPFGAFECVACGSSLERLHPGYPDPDAPTRELVCPYCGKRQMPSRAGGARTRARAGSAG